MNADQLLKNAQTHGLCSEGLHYIEGKSLDLILIDSTPRVADLIFWFCAKNAGSPGWPTADQVLAVLARVVLISHEYVGIMKEVVSQEYSVAKKLKTSEAILTVYFGLETHITWHDPSRMLEFKDRILSSVSRLRPTI